MMLESRALDEVSRHGGRVHDSGLVQLVGEDAAKIQIVASPILHNNGGDRAMLALAGERYLSFIKWLNKYYPSKAHVELVYLVGHESVISSVLGISTKDEFDIPDLACYVPEEYAIYVADMDAVADAVGHPSVLEPDEDLLAIAHEYAHHLQHIEGKPFDDEEADRLAKEMVEGYLREFAEQWKRGY